MNDPKNYQWRTLLIRGERGGRDDPGGGAKHTTKGQRGRRKRDLPTPLRFPIIPTTIKGKESEKNKQNNTKDLHQRKPSHRTQVRRGLEPVQVKRKNLPKEFHPREIANTPTSNKPNKEN
jgi:hypothetical protein